MPRPPHQEACASVETPIEPPMCADQPSPVCTSQWSWRAGKYRIGLPRGGLDDLAHVAHDQRAARHHAEVDGLEVGELRVVALDRHHGLPRGDLVALVQRLDLEVLPAVDPQVALVVAGALLEHRDRLVDPAEDRLLALEDLHQHPRVVAVGLQQLLGQVEVRVGVVAVADLLHRQAEDGRRQAHALADGHLTRRSTRWRPSAVSDDHERRRARRGRPRRPPSSARSASAAARRSTRSRR